MEGLFFKIVFLTFHVNNHANAYNCSTPKAWLKYGDISKHLKENRTESNPEAGEIWPGGVVKYQLHSSLSGEDMEQVNQTFEEYHKKTCIKFEPFEEGDQNYVSIETDNKICGLAHVCMRGGSQFAKFGKKCRHKNTMVHELGHTICLSHEESQPDNLTIICRDRYVQNKTKESVPVLRIYDQASQMHVGCNSTTNKCGNQITSGLSSLDADYINAMYNCQGCLRHRWIPIKALNTSDSSILHNFRFIDLDIKPIYTCRVSFKGQLNVGKYNSRLKACSVGFNGKEYQLCEKFEVFTIPGGPYKEDAEYAFVEVREDMSWEEKNAIFDQAVVAGREPWINGSGYYNGYVAYGALSGISEICNTTGGFVPWFGGAGREVDTIGRVWKYENSTDAAATLCKSQFQLTNFHILVCRKPKVIVSEKSKTETKTKTLHELHSTYIWIGIGGGVALLILAFSTVFGIWRVRRLKKILDEADIKEFFNGRSDAARNDGNSVENALKFPYDKSLEIRKDKMIIDEEHLLGSGQFGYVYKAAINRGNGFLEVALKTTKSDVAASAIKGILSEIKILTYLGKHPNIVVLQGAYTSELSKGVVYMATELCSFGSLESYIRDGFKTKAPTTRNENRYTTLHGNEEQVELVEKKEVDFFEMVRWSHEIACGMEHLDSKHVVHADLATRNVLLTAERTAKITDFGLSRRMYDYQNYVKTHQEPLPWRWMAIESLKRCEFSSRSDAWSYGVTLWEIFTMGDTPYPGLSWTLDFTERLVDGLRLESPRLATPEMLVKTYRILTYSVMSRCWNIEPRERPTFTDLKMLTGEILKTGWGAKNKED